MTAVIRTSTGVLVPNVSPFWGTTLHPGTDPDAPTLPEAAMAAISLAPDLGPAGDARIPARLWQRVVALYYHVLDWSRSKSADSTCEVQVVFLRGNGSTRPRTAWRVLAPTQEVGGAYVKTDYTKPLVDLETGETVNGVDTLAGDGWLVAGTSHSHGTIGAFFSGTDDRSELSQPGVHIVLGNLRPGRYEYAVSVVMRGTRYKTVMDLSAADGARRMDLDDLVDSTPGTAPVLPAVMAVVQRSAPVVRTVVGGWDDTFPTATTGFKVWVVRFQGFQARLVRVAYQELAIGSHYWSSALKAMAGCDAAIKGGPAGKVGMGLGVLVREKIVSDDCDIAAVRAAAHTWAQYHKDDATKPGARDDDQGAGNAESDDGDTALATVDDPDAVPDCGFSEFMAIDPDPEEIINGAPLLADFVTALIDADFKRKDVTTIVRLMAEHIPGSESMLTDAYDPGDDSDQ